MLPNRNLDSHAVLGSGVDDLCHYSCDIKGQLMLRSIRDLPNYFIYPRSDCLYHYGKFDTLFIPLGECLFLEYLLFDLICFYLYNRRFALAGSGSTFYQKILLQPSILYGLLLKTYERFLLPCRASFYAVVLFSMV